MYVNQILVRLKWATQYILMPFGDLQAGSPVFCREKWDEYVASVKAKKGQVMTIGMGDYSDHFRPTIQGRLRSALDADSSKTFDEMHRKHIRREVYPLLLPVINASSCLGLLGGHHDLTYSDGTNSTQYLCQLLHVPYLGDGEAMLRVNLKPGSQGYSFNLWATHGDGNGGAVGSNISKLQRMLAHIDADILLRGHSCDKFIFQEPQYYMTHSNPPRIRQRNRLIANCGSFSDGRSEKETTYVEKKNLAPKALGWVEIHLNLTKDPDNRNSRYLVMGD